MQANIRRLLSYPSSLLSLRNWLKMTGQRLVCPFYHVISDEYLPHIAPLYAYRNVKRFERDLDVLLKDLTPISLKDLFEKSVNQAPFQYPTFFLSFDDGLREIGEIVAPLLFKKGIPATFFVNPGFVGNKALFYRYKASLLVDRLKSYKGTLPAFPFNDDIKSSGDWEKWILSARHDNDAQLDSLSILLEVDFGAFLQDAQPYLTLDQIRDLCSLGFDIGGHSIDHPLYRLTTLDHQVQQSIQSMEWVRENDMESVPCFAFPFTDDGVTKATIRQIRQSGFPHSLLFGTAGIKTEQDKFHFQRLSMEGTESSASSILRSELLSFWLKSAINKHHLQRL